MTDALLSVLAENGAWMLALLTFMSCLALPVPASLAMLAAGAFSASGDMSIIQVIFAAYVGAILGDQTGYALGRAFGSPLLRAALTPARARVLGKARHFIAKWGGIGVFLSRWLASPLGPYVNFLAFAGGVSWLRFSFWGAIGEAIWVVGYVGLGWAFATSFLQVADLASTLSGLIAALAALLIAGLWLKQASKRRLPRHL
jgi:membrane-associated protein